MILFSQKSYIFVYNYFQKKNSEEPTFYRGQAECYVQTHNLDMAILDFRRVLSFQPQHMRDKKALINALLDAGKFDKAVMGENITFN